MSNIPNRSVVDVSFSGSGTVYLFHLNTDAARDWVEEFVSDERQFLGNALAVEHRYVGDLAAALQNDGFAVEVL